MKNDINKSGVICIVCGGRSRFQYKNIINGKSILRCQDCGLWMLYPPLSDEDRRRIYKSGYYAQWGYVTEAAPSLTLIKKILYDDILRQIERYIKPARLLDIGCAMGFSLEVAGEHGWRPCGIEISEFSGKIAKEKFGSAVRIGDILDVDFTEGGFDAVTMVDLIEHVPDPIKIFEKAKSFLRDDGILALVTPDISSLSSKLLKRWWPNLKEEHLCYFSKNSITLALSKTGFDIKQIKAFPKPITLSYAHSILRNSEPTFFYYVLCLLNAIMPQHIKTRSFRLPVGEILVIAQKRADEKHL